MTKTLPYFGRTLSKLDPAMRQELLGVTLPRVSTEEPIALPNHTPHDLLSLASSLQLSMPCVLQGSGRGEGRGMLVLQSCCTVVSSHFSEPGDASLAVWDSVSSLPLIF